MCIAVAKPMGVKMPDKETLKRCWDNNPDGAGYAFNANGVVCIHKGFMTFDAFWDSLKESAKRYNFDKCGVLLHFRIATHGGVIPAMTHPFPIVEDNGALAKLQYVSNFAVIHNGIISLTSAKARQEQGMSDTAIFVRDYLSKIAQNRQWFRRKANMELIEKLIDSKMAILNGRGEIIHTSGFTEDGGVLYSNSTYKDFRNRYFSSRYGDYDDDDCGYYAGAYKNYRSYTTGASGYNALYDNRYGSQKYNSVPLMRISRGETIEGDMISEECHSDTERNYAVSKEGFLYEIIPDVTTHNNYSSGYGPEYSLEYLGTGEIFVGGKRKDFTPNYWPNSRQFLGGDTPDVILECEEPDFDESDFAEEDDSGVVTPLNSDTPEQEETE